ncbi:MAG: geranylgeranyl pyrophosphate synthetase [Alectoria sarmentosa]|nr:MAG: geranylgeranyl pyrophosphate synthetase [Alectoria sarmentosa]
MFAVLFHIIAMFLPSRLLTLPKISENMEISINSPKTIRTERDTDTSTMPTAMGQRTEGPIVHQETRSSTASSLSGRLDAAEAGTETRTPRSLTPDSTVESEGSPGCKKIPSSSELWTEQSEKAITRPFEYVMSLPGKNFRTQVLAAFNVWLQVDERSLNIIDRVVGMLHNASLLIDDIQDGSQLRRGFPAAHCIFGTAQSINAANYAYFLAQQELIQLDNPVEAFRIYNEEMLNLHRGQGIELFWRETMTIPTEDEYLLMISNKTGGLFRLAARLMQSASSTTHDILPLTNMIGLIFQIRDDYNNLCSEQMTAAKGFCEDLTEGKFSLPVIHSIRSSSTYNNELLNILKMRTTDPSLKSHALWYMRMQTKSLNYTKSMLRDLHQQAQMAVGRIDGSNDMIQGLLGKLSLD